MQSALELLCNVQAKSTHSKIIVKIGELTHIVGTDSHDFAFQWVLSHTGLIGNKRADELAKRAREYEEEYSITLFSNDIKNVLRKLSARK